MFKNVLDNVVVIINENNSLKKFYKEINYTKCYAIYNINNLKLKQNKIINNTYECIEKCNDSTIYKYEYNGKCYENCTNGFFYDDNDSTVKCKCELEKCLVCPQVALNKKLCTVCNENYYPKENDPLNLGEYINCYNASELEGYHLDNNIFKKVKKVSTSELLGTEIKTTIGNNIDETNKKETTTDVINSDETHTESTYNSQILTEYNEKSTFEFTNIEYINYSKNCTYYHYFDVNNNYLCTNNFSCPNEYPILISDKMECIDYNLEYIKVKLNNEKNGTENKTYEEKIDNYDKILKIIERVITAENFNTSNLDNGNEEIIKTEKMTIVLANSKNQGNDINNNIVTIDLRNCETLLKKFYNISSNEALYIKKLIVIQEGMEALKVDYQVYSRLFGKNLTNLNLSICENDKISLINIMVVVDIIMIYVIQLLLNMEQILH